jgi:hypothetical protein
MLLGREALKAFPQSQIVGENQGRLHLMQFLDVICP